MATGIGGRAGAPQGCRPRFTPIVSHPARFANDFAQQLKKVSKMTSQFHDSVGCLFRLTARRLQQ